MTLHQSELHRQNAHYAAIKAKLYGRPANVNIKTKPIEQVEPEELPEPEAHVQAVETAPPRIVFQPKKRIPQNMWEKARITFNQHVIDYRLYLFDKERRAAGYVEPENKSKGQKPVVPVKDRKPIIDIVLDVLDQFPGITVDELRGPGRTRRLVRPRQMAMFKLHKQRPDLSLPAIGRWFGGRDHTTVLHSIRRVEAQIARQEASK